jgi:TolB-like protein
VIAIVLFAVTLGGLAILRITNDRDRSVDQSLVRIALSDFELSVRNEQTERFAKGLESAFERTLSRSDVQLVGQKRKGNSEPVEFVLRGAIDEHAAQVVVNVDLVNSSNGAVLWSTTVARDLVEPRFTQEEVSLLVATVVRCAVDIRGAMANDSSTSLFSDVLRYCEVQFGEGRLPPAELPGLSSRIREAAPQYAISHALCAIAHASATQVRGAPTAERERLRGVASECARRAIELDPSLGLTYLALAIALDPANRLVEQEDLLRKCFIDARFHYCKAEYANFLNAVGRKREALHYFRRAVDEDPFAGSAPRRALALETAEVGYVNDARQMFQSVANIWPNVSLRQWFWAEHYFGDPQKALDLLRDGGLAKTFAASSGVVGGGTDSIPCIEEFLNARIKHVALTEQEIAVACQSGFQDPPANFYAYFGHVDAAYREMERNADRYARGAGWLHELFRPYSRSVRADPRFMPFVARVGLVDYWLETDRWPDFCSTEALQYDCKEAALSAQAQLRTLPVERS